MTYTRRQILTAGALGVAAVLAGCGQAAAPAPSTPPSSAPPAAKPSASAAGKPAASQPPGSSAATKPAASQAASPASSAATKPSGLTFSIAYGAPGGFTVPLWLADSLHAFTEAGVTAKIQYIESSAAVAALIAKDVDAILLSAAPVITADLNGGADLVFTASILNHPVFALYTEPGIKTAAEVRGKVVATDRPNTPTDYGFRLIMSRIGLKPTDVKALPVGGSAATIAALTSGQAQAAVVSPPQSFQAEARGFHAVHDIYDVQYQGVGVVMSRARIDQTAAATIPFFQGLRRGVLAYNQQPDLAMRLLSQYTKETDANILQKTYDFYRTQASFEPSLKPTTEGIQSMIDFLAESIPAAKAAKPEQFVDLRVLSRVPA